MTHMQERTCKAIVNYFETSSFRGNYGKVAVAKGDLGGLSYGRSQVTRASGGLARLLFEYVNAGGLHRVRIANYLARANRCDPSLDNDYGFRLALIDAGNDPIMQRCQDILFDRDYWKPALVCAETQGVATPLGICVLYDSRVHGSLGKMIARTIAEYGAVADIGEFAFVARYVQVRREWLSTHANTLLRATVYRMDTFRELIGSNKWELGLPLVIRGVKLTEDMLT